MLAIAAFVCFLVAFILGLMEVAAGNWNLIALGLALLALHFVWPVGFGAGPVGRFYRRG